MAMFALIFVPETKNIPQESVKLLFEGNIIKGAIRDCNPRWQRAKVLRDVHLAGSGRASETSEAGLTAYRTKDEVTMSSTSDRRV